MPITLQDASLQPMQDQDNSVYESRRLEQPDVTLESDEIVVTRAKLNSIVGTWLLRASAVFPSSGAARPHNTSVGKRDK
jgi:hypothetical protein